MVGFLLLTHVLCLCTLIGMATSVEAAVKPDAEFLAAGLAQQEPASGQSLRLTWTSSPAPPMREGQIHTEVRYIRTKSVLFREERRARVKASGAIQPDFIVRRRYDRVSGEYRECVTTGNPDSKLPPRATMLTSPEIPSRFTGDQLVDPPLFSLMAERLPRIIAAGSVADTQEDVDGYACWRVEVPERQVGTELRQRCTIWVDVAIGFCPRRLTEFLIRGDVTHAHTWVFSDYRELGDGVFIPMRVTVSFSEPGTTQRRFEVTSVDSGAEVPESDMAVAIPSGAQVWVLPEGAYVTAP